MKTLREEVKENRKSRQKRKVDRHCNLKDTNRTEHDTHTYKTKNKYTTMNDADNVKLRIWNPWFIGLSVSRSYKILYQ